MSRSITQPVNQVRLTNVAVVRLKKHGKRFEVRVAGLSVPEPALMGPASLRRYGASHVDTFPAGGRLQEQGHELAQ
jgi:hypothetical protein